MPSYYKEPEDKECKNCKITKKIENFHKAGKWRQACCKNCTNERAKLRHRKLKGKRIHPPVEGSEAHKKLCENIKKLKIPKSAKIYGISSATLYSWIKKGKFKPS